MNGCVGRAVAIAPVTTATVQCIVGVGIVAKGTVISVAERSDFGHRFRSRSAQISGGRTPSGITEFTGAGTERDATVKVFTTGT